MKGFLLPVVFVLTVLASLLYVRSRFLLVEVSYDIGEKREQRSNLEQKKRVLVLELARLQSSTRIEKIAKAQLHLSRPQVPVPQVVVNGESP